jgi:hypothetical protein
MKSFKGYLTESQAQFNTKDMIFTNAETPALILSTTALERAFGGLARIKGWHVTDLTGFKGLKKLQGKKSSISVMTEIEPSDHQPFDGIETEGGIVVELEGTELISSGQDVWSERLEGGRRGISVTKGMFPHMHRHLEFMVKEMYEKFSKKTHSKNSRQLGFDLNELGKVLSQKEKGQFIKEYIDNCESILSKNKRVREELRKYGRTMNTKLNKKHFYNESVVNQISIKNVYAVFEKFDKWASSPWGNSDTEEKFEEEEKLLQKYWKNIQIKSQQELISLINKK